MESAHEAKARQFAADQQYARTHRAPLTPGRSLLRRAPARRACAACCGAHRCASRWWLTQRRWKCCWRHAPVSPLARSAPHAHVQEQSRKGNGPTREQQGKRARTLLRTLAAVSAYVLSPQAGETLLLLKASPQCRPRKELRTAAPHCCPALLPRKAAPQSCGVADLR